MISIVGMFVLGFIAYLFCDNRKAINFRTVLGAFAIQASIAALVLYVPFGQQILASISTGVQSVIGYSDVGIGFIFGNLSNAGNENIGFVFAIKVLPVLIFFSALVAVLYYLGIVQLVINFLGGGISKLLGTGHAESLSATANIFVSQTEAPLIIRPYIMGMTQSELFAVMVGGMASIAGSLLVGYANMGVDIKYLIASSFMAAPGGLMMAKLMKPETGTPELVLENVTYSESGEPANVIDAAASGAIAGMKLAVNIGAMLIAFIALIALLNDSVAGIFGWVGIEGMTVEKMLGYVFFPITYLIGVPMEDAVTAGGLIGQKLVLNEFVAYASMIQIQDTLNAHTQVIITFALCGFANFSSIAIMLGGLGSIAPKRNNEIAKLGLKAVLAASLANLMSAALAGFFITL